MTGRGYRDPSLGVQYWPDPLWAAWGSMEIYPLWYPPPLFKYKKLSDWQKVQEMNRQYEWTEKLLAHYDLESWARLARYAGSNLTIHDWLGSSWWDQRFGLPHKIKEAIKAAFNKLSDAEKTQAKQAPVQAPSDPGLKFPQPAASSLYKYR